MPRIASPSVTPRTAASHSDRRPGEDHRQQHDRDGEELVEDLAVLVDVVPDEVRVQRRDHRCDEAHPLRDEAPPDLVDE